VAVLVVVLLVVAVVLLVALAVSLPRASRRARTATARGDDLAARLTGVEGERDAATARAEAGEERAQEQETRAGDAERRATDLVAQVETLELSANDAARRCAELEASVTDLTTARDAAEAERDDASQQAAALAAALRSAHAGGDDPNLLWALDLARVARRWREDVAPDPDAPSPLGIAADPLRIAVDIEAAAVKESAGTAVAVEWGFEAPLGPPAALAVLRVVQEVLAAGSKAVDAGVLRVHPDGRDVVVRFDAAPGEEDALVPPDPFAGARPALLAVTDTVQVTAAPGKLAARLTRVLPGS
jgi:hypothetical protein